VKLACLVKKKIIIMWTCDNDFWNFIAAENVCKIKSERNNKKRKKSVIEEKGDNLP